jgi:NADP-dependent aldehyde dehydrogenase
MLNQNLRENFRARLGEIGAAAGVKTLAQGGPAEFAKMAPSLFETDAATWTRTRHLHEEAFGPAALIVHCRDAPEAPRCIDRLEGNLTGTVHADAADQKDARLIIPGLGGKSRPGDRQRLPDGRRGEQRDRSRRPVPGDDRTQARPASAPPRSGGGSA